MQLLSKTLTRFIDGSAVASFIIDKHHQVTHWNTALEALSGVKREDMIGKDSHSHVFYREKRPTMADMIIDKASKEEISWYYGDKAQKSRLIAGAYEAEDFFPGLNKAGKWLHFTASPVLGDDGEMVGAIETLSDVTDRKELEGNLRYFLQQTTRAHEEERKYIARELHDDMAQILGSLSRQLDNVLRKGHHFKPVEVTDLKEIQQQLNHGLLSLQRFIQNLRPSLLDDLGLIPALRSMTNSLEDSDGLVTLFTVKGKERRFKPEVELFLFRIVQEALSNVKKHAEATEVRVSADFDDKGITLTVQDNGKGFELSGDMDSLPRQGMLGLMGIRERVWLLGGSVDIDSAPGKGTTLKVVAGY